MSIARRRCWPRIAAIVVFALVAIAATLAATGGFLDRNPITRFKTHGRRAGVSALYFSGDMGLRYGMGPATSRALAAHGVPVLGIASSTLFRTSKTRTQTDAIVTNAARQALAQAGDDRLVLIGQSYGADVLQTGLTSLPVDLRRRVAGVVLVVPGSQVFFRADPTGLEYHGAPDSDGDATLRRLTWVPLTCIYGLAETDSACPAARTLANATVIGMPGGHFLNHDDDALVGHVLAAIERAKAPTRA